MDFALVATCFAVVFVAELPDKTALATLVLGSRYRPLFVFAGVAAAFAVHVVLAVGAGSLMCSHVNDSGFWMFKEYFGLSLKDTFRSWTAMETIVGVFGLVFVLCLNVFV